MTAHGAVRHDLEECYDIAKAVIGEGGFSTVRRGKSRGVEARAVAVKRLKDEQACDLAVYREVAAMLALGTKHPNIMAFHGLFRCVGPASIEWAMVMEFCPGRDLYNATEKADGLPQARMSRILKGLLSALAHIHAHRFVHRDVKADNILLVERDRPVLIDFGTACHLEDRVAMVERPGTLGYAAPEVLACNPYGRRVDTFSAGVVLFYGLTALLPFQGDTISSTMRKTSRAHVDLTEAPNMHKVSAGAKVLIRGLLSRSPKARLTAEAALEHGWIRTPPPEEPTPLRKAVTEVSERTKTWRMAEVAAALAVGRLAGSFGAASTMKIGAAAAAAAAAGLDKALPPKTEAGGWGHCRNGGWSHCCMDAWEDPRKEQAFGAAGPVRRSSSVGALMLEEEVGRQPNTNGVNRPQTGLVG
jgi:serine/threonine protein kinase